MNIQEALGKNSKIELTLFNEHKESLALGDVNFIKQLKYRTILRWDLEERPVNIWPFTFATLHNGVKVIETFFVKPIEIDTNITTIELRKDN